MTNSELADHDGSPYMLIDDGAYQLWTSFDGEMIWWREVGYEKKIAVFCAYLGAPDVQTGHRELHWERAWKLIDLAKCSPDFDNAPFPESVSLDDVVAAFAADRIIIDPRRANMVRIYCYLKPETPDGQIIGVAAAPDGEVILEHPSLDVRDVRPALGFEPDIYNHSVYDAKYGRGNWELLWVDDYDSLPWHFDVAAKEFANLVEEHSVPIADEADLPAPSPAATGVVPMPAELTSQYSALKRRETYEHVQVTPPQPKLTA